LIFQKGTPLLATARPSFMPGAVGLKPAFGACRGERAFFRPPAFSY